MGSLVKSPHSPVGTEFFLLPSWLSSKESLSNRFWLICISWNPHSLVVVLIGECLFPVQCFIPSCEKVLFPLSHLGWEFSYSLVELHCWDFLFETSHIFNRRGVFLSFLCKVHLISNKSPMVIFLGTVQSSLTSPLRVCIEIWVSSVEFPSLFVARGYRSLCFVTPHRVLDISRIFLH